MCGTIFGGVTTSRYGRPDFVSLMISFSGNSLQKRMSFPVIPNFEFAAQNAFGQHADVKSRAIYDIVELEFDASPPSSVHTPITTAGKLVSPTRMLNSCGMDVGLKDAFCASSMVWISAELSKIYLSEYPTDPSVANALFMVTPTSFSLSSWRDTIVFPERSRYGSAPQSSGSDSCAPWVLYVFKYHSFIRSCFDHQIVGRAMGVKVGRSDRGEKLVFVRWAWRRRGRSFLGRTNWYTYTIILQPFDLLKSNWKLRR